MSDIERIEKVLTSIKDITGIEYFERFSNEIHIAQRLIDAHPEREQQWQPLVDKAIEHVGSEKNKNKAIADAEKILDPIGKELKEYIIFCAGHAHIDMNWMWNWPETVSVTNDTFSTVDRLLDEFPDFEFSQSQA